jgi:transcriptional regulator with XRE-family HTH domain
MKDNDRRDPNLLLARRIKAERTARDWSLADLAKFSGVSAAMISKVERGESSPTAVLLGRLSGAFRLSISQLFAPDEPRPGRVSRQQDQLVWRDPKTKYLRRTLSPPGCAGPLELVWVELPVGAEIAYPATAYTFIDQQLVVTEGELTFVQGAETYLLKGGDCLHLGSPAECKFINAGRAVCRYLVAVAHLPNRI